MGAWVVALVLVGGLLPEIVQRFVVAPNELVQERPYIANNMNMTRLAFGIDQWEDGGLFRGDAPLTAEAIAEEEDTFRNARLWDYRPLQSTLGQLQAVRQYYTFHDVDTDRYVVDDVQRQVMLAGRELNLDTLTGASWVNERVSYTHGIGLAMVPVNEVTRPEGQPRLWVRDLPPVSTADAPTITEPRIYFGELDDHYVVVGARQPEFDYPQDSGGASQDIPNRWTGTTGIKLDGADAPPVRPPVPRSGPAHHRPAPARQPAAAPPHARRPARRIAPFLRYDKDPYLVVTTTGA